MTFELLEETCIQVWVHYSMRVKKFELFSMNDISQSYTNIGYVILYLNKSVILSMNKQ